MKSTAFFSLVVFAFYACGLETSTDNSANKAVANVSAENASAASSGSGAGNESDTAALINEPKTVRDFFMLLAEKYCVLEGCDKAKDNNCNKARGEHLK